jgi:hypothetical protein
LAGKSLADKLLLKPGRTVRIIDAPPGYLDLLGRLPEGVRLAECGPTDVIQVFTTTKAGSEAHFAALKADLKPGGLLWVCYPKGTSKIPSEVNRDILWAAAKPYGFEGVAMVAIDEDWSAMRFKAV